MLRTAELEYDLPAGVVATTAAEPRDSARLMVVNRSDASRLEHGHIRDLPGHVRAGDLLVFNTTRVLPARLMGQRHETGGRVEGLYLSNAGAPSGSQRWTVLLKGGHLRPGVVIDLYGADGSTGLAQLSLIERSEAEDGAWTVEVRSLDPFTPPERVLEKLGRTPLPPYILKARRDAGLSITEEADRARYQTVYAAASGSVAAPTAGLHFTPELLTRLGAMGVQRADVVLHVGTGTFKPVETEFVEQHPMHHELCEMNAAAQAQVKAAKREGRRVIAVGTTAARTLEAFAAAPDGTTALNTNILITPGHPWRWVDGILTNFHLPRSTLLAMIAALFPSGVSRVKELYAEAISRGYRFYSYGDAMLILP